MKADRLLYALEQMGINTITGVPDSTLKQFCDGLQNYHGNLKHYVPVNEGAAVGLAIGSYLADGKPVCVYMQNSGIGNAINPIRHWRIGMCMESRYYFWLAGEGNRG